jgi:hypothetical protein
MREMSAAEILSKLQSIKLEGAYLEELEELAERLGVEDPEGEGVEPVLKFLEDDRIEAYRRVLVT